MKFSAKLIVAASVASVAVTGTAIAVPIALLVPSSAAPAAATTAPTTSTPGTSETGGSGTSGSGTASPGEDSTPTDVPSSDADDTTDDGVGYYVNPYVVPLNEAQQLEKDAFVKKYPGSMENDSSIAQMAFLYWGDTSDVSDKKFPADFALPSFVNWIGIGSFLSAKLNASFALPDAVVWIGAAAFFGAILPTNFRLPQSLQVLYVGAFAGQTFSNGFTITPDVTNLGMWPGENGGKALDYASPFAFASFGSDFTLPTTLVNIADDTFAGSGASAYLDAVKAENPGYPLPALFNSVQFGNVMSTVPVGFTIPETTHVWKLVNKTWTHSADNVLKVNIPANAHWSDPKGAVSGSTVVSN